ncbi:MAG: hypothetical protein RIR79_27 [Pseudomonadota bacterium]|jgi:uncharacterized repeat protein (TIGR02059 family)
MGISMTTSIQTVLQKIAILITGHGANAAQLQELEGLAGSDGKYFPLIEGINDFLGKQAQASSPATLVGQLAQNGLGISLSTTDSTEIANYIGGSKISWAEVVVTCLQIGGSAGVTLDNRTTALNSFLDQLTTTGKTDLFMGASVLQTVKNLVQNVDASTSSLSNGQAGFSTLSTILSSNGIRGSVVDGYVKDATIFVDANGDGKLNDGEFSATTDASGHYNLPLNAGIGKLIASGGTDILTGKPFKGVMTALPGSTTINPITTLIEAVGSKAQSLAELANTTSIVQKALGLPSNINLLTYDPLAVLADSSASTADKATALAVQKTALQIQNIITQIGNTLDASSSNVNAVHAAEATTDTLASLISHSSTVIDLTDTTLLTGVVQSSATQLGLPTTATQAGQIAAVTSASNVATQAAQDITKLAQVAVVAQSNATDELIAAAGGSGNFATVAHNFTGSSLQTAVSNATTGDVAVGVPTPSSPKPEPTYSYPTPQSDLVIPIMGSAVLAANGTTLTLTYSEPLTGVPEATDYAITGNTITNAILSGNTVILTLGTPVITGTTVSNLVYTASAGTTPNSIKDAATPTPNAATTQTWATVTNNSTVPAPDTTAPTILSAALEADGVTLTITYSEPLTGTAEASDYTWTGNTITNAVIGTGANNNKVILTLGTPVIQGATLSGLFTYTANNGVSDSIKDAATPTPNTAATTQILTTNFTNGSTVAPVVADTTAPTMSSAAVSADGTQIVITYSEALTGTPEAADYAATGVNLTGATAAITGTTNNQVTLTLATALDSAATVSNLVYTASAGTANSIKDAATTPNNAVDQTLAAVTNGSTVLPPSTSGTAPVLVTLPNQTIRVDSTMTPWLEFNEPVHAGTGTVVLVNDSGGSNINVDVTDNSKVSFSTNSSNQHGISSLNLSHLGLVVGHNYHLEIPSGAILDANNESFAGLSSPTGIVFNVVADATPPFMRSAAVAADGKTLTITYTEALTGTPEVADYAATGVNLTGATAAITGTTNNQVTLTLATALDSAATVSNLVYTASAGTANSIKDAATTPNNAVDQMLAAVTNGSTVAPPSTSGTAPILVTPNQTFRIDPTSPMTEIIFNEPVHAGTGTVVLVDDSTVNPVNINIDITDTSKIEVATYRTSQGKTKLHTSALGLVAGHNYHLTIPSGAILDANNESFAGLSSPTGIVLNVVADATPPHMRSAVVSADGTTLTIIYSEALAGTAEAGDYTLAGNTVTAAIIGTGADSNKVILTLGTPVTSAIRTDVTYTAANGTPNSIKDAATPSNAAYTSRLQPSDISYDGFLALIYTGQPETIMPTTTSFSAQFSSPIHAGTGNLVLKNDTGGADIIIDVTDTNKVSFWNFISHGSLYFNNIEFVVGQKYHLEIPAGAVLRNSDNAPFGGLTDTNAIVLNVVSYATHPHMQNAVVSADGTTLTIIYSEALAGTAEASDYTVVGNTVTNAVIGAGANNNKVILTLGTPVTSAIRMDVTYTATNGTPDSIKDTATPSNAAYSDILPASQITYDGILTLMHTGMQQTDPILTNVVTFSSPVHAGTGNLVLKNDTGGADITIDVLDTAKVIFVSYTDGSGLQRGNFNLRDAGLVVGQKYHLEIPAGAVLRDSDNAPFAGLTDPAALVFNVVADARAPWMQNASVAANGTTLTLTYSEALTGTVELGDYTVGGNTVTAAIIGTGADNNKVILTLGTPVTSASLTGVTYTATNGTPNSIKDTANPANAAYTSTLQPSEITYDGFPTLMYTGNPRTVDPTSYWNIPTFSSPVHAGTGNLVLKNDSGGADITIDVTDTNKVIFNSYTYSGGVQRGDVSLRNSGLVVGQKYHLEIPAGAILRNSDNAPFGGLTDPNAIVWNVVADAVPPHMRSAVVSADGTTLTIIYSEPLTGTVEKIDYTVAGNTVTAAIIGTGADSNKVILTLGTPVTSASLTGVTYTATNGTPNSIKDAATPANAAYTSTLQPSEITYDGILTLLYTGYAIRVEPTSGNITIARFSSPIHAGAGNLVLKNDTVAGADITIDVLDASKVSFSSYTNGYGELHLSNLGLVVSNNYHLEIPAGAILQNGTNTPFGGLTDPTALVLNVVADAMQPRMQNAVVSADGATLTLTYSEALAGTAEVVDYTVGGNTVTSASIGAGLDNNKVILTLGTPVTTASLTGVTYTATNGTPDSITDLANPANAAYDYTLRASDISYDGFPTLMYTGNGPSRMEPNSSYNTTFSHPVHAGTGNLVLKNDSGGADITIDVTDTSKVYFYSSNNQGRLSFSCTELLAGNKYHLEIPTGAILQDGTNIPFPGLTDPNAIVLDIVADATSPWMNAPISANGTTVTLTYSEALTGTPEIGDYTVTGNTVTNAVIGTGADSNKVILTLGSPAATAFDVTYTANNGNPNSITDLATPANAAYTDGREVAGNPAVQAIYKYLHTQSVSTFTNTDILAFKDTPVGDNRGELRLTGTSTKVFNSGTAAGIIPTADDNIWVITDAQPTWNSAAAVDAAMASATVTGMDNGLVLVFNNGTENQVWYVGSAHTGTNGLDVTQLATVTLTGTTTLSDLTANNFFVY